MRAPVPHGAKGPAVVTSRRTLAGNLQGGEQVATRRSTLSTAKYVVRCSIAAMIQGGGWALPSPVPVLDGKGLTGLARASPPSPFAGNGASLPDGAAALAASMLAAQPQPAAPAAPVPREDPLSVAIREALEPMAGMDPEWSLDEMCKRIQKYMFKAVSKFWHDERLCMPGSPPQAHAFVTEFVDAVMGAMSNACYDRVWFPQTNFAGPIYEAVVSIAKGKKLFARVMTPGIMHHVEEGLFRFKEEDRIQNTFYEAISASCLPESFHKKGKAQLQSSFDEAHTTAPYGVSSADDPTTALLKDFVLGWMRSFCTRSFHILQQGVSREEDQQKLFVTVLFQTLVGPEMRCLPFDLMNEFHKPGAVATLPDAGWHFVAEATEAIFAEELDTVPRPLKMPRTGNSSGFTLPNGTVVQLQS